MEYKLKDIAHINQETLKKDSFPNSFLYLDTKNLTSGKFGELAYFDSMKDKVPSNARRVVKENDILISTVRPNQRHYGFITKDQKSYIVSVGFAVITPEETKVNPYFLYKYLTLENITHYLQSIAENSASAYPAIKPSVLSELSINLPDITIQYYISKLLRSLDDKINLNEQIIANLEELSQTLFKRWFVDFEFPDENGNPYKSNGGEMIDSELGMVPKGWNFEKLKLLIENIKDNIRTKSLSQEDRYVPIDLIPKRKLTFYDYKSSNEAKSSLIKFKKNDILLGSMRVYFHRVSLAPFDGITRNTVFTLRPRDERYLYYLLNAINKDDFIQYAANNSKGSTMPYAVWDGILDEVTVLNPPLQYLIEFNSIVQKYFDISIILLKQNRQLEDLRDTLLPKLMSGEIEIPDDI
ncbi:MAG TPA: restriction endonuclease subunit S [Staphylococcus saprophyticus]|nr:restriction endonuclease subunit S [Staphylococcus saprophyticus]